MADEKPKIQIDTDWKRQAQEEKRRLAEQEQQRAAESVPQPAPSVPAAGASDGGAASAGTASARGTRELPPANFSSLVQSLTTQVLLYLGELSTRTAQPMLDLDMAKYQIDMLGVLEEKTRGNLSEEEKRMLDTSLYEVRMRYVSVAQQYIG